MYARPSARPRNRRSQVRQFPAPTAGWISNRALAVPGGQEGNAVQGAAVLDNFIPRATSVVMRRGKLRYCTLGDGSEPARSLFSYNNGPNKRLFAASDSTIYDITDVEFAEDAEIVTETGDLIVTELGDWFGWSSTEFLSVMTGFTGGEWIVVQFATTGGVFLVGVNGQDPGFIYDGTLFYPITATGVWKMPYTGMTTPFTEGATLTGTTSTATGTIVGVFDQGGGAGFLLLSAVAGDFQLAEAITDSSGGAGVSGAALDDALPDVPGMTFTGGITSADMAFVWVYRNRLYFAEKDTMNAWYLGVDAIGGAAEVFPLAGIFGLGGVLLFGQRWSLSSGGDGGLSEQNVFVSSEGEVAVFQGIYPEDAQWQQQGLYRVGKPLGRRAFIRGAGDIAIATTVGLVPLSKAIELDLTALTVAAISYPIADAWSEAVDIRGSNWVGEIWSEQKIAVFAPPTVLGLAAPVMFIANTETGAWSRFTNWEGLCMEVFEGRLFFGETNGAIYVALQTGQDDGDPYTSALLPLFTDLGNPAAIKIAKVGRYVLRASTSLVPRLSWHSDYDETMPSPPDAVTIGGAGSVWGQGIWGQSVWSDNLPRILSDNWQSLGGIGYNASVSCQITSGALQPVDGEVISCEVLYDTGESIS